MSRHAARTRRTRRIWTIGNGLVLAVASVWVLTIAFDSAPAAHPVSSADLLVRDLAPSEPAPAPAVSPPPGKADYLRPARPRFGVSYPEAPFGPASLATIGANAGAAPTLIEYFVKWTEEFRPAPALACYRAGALPVVAWEPWAGEQDGGSQPKYALRRIIGGDYDPYITRVALGMRDTGSPIVLRFAHEMNGKWYPWSEARSGNAAGEYVRAWRHVHDIFTAVGAVNVIWVWSPNIIRPAPSVQLGPLYPGDGYVDWVGLVGYAVKEHTPAEVFGPTLKILRRFTAKPLLITETGAQPGPYQASWTRDLFRWIAAQKDAVGFIWFEFDRAGATADWRFSRSPATLAAFRAGVAATALAPPVRR
ncbi:MAG: mannan endo,4-beta-mannosidase [Cryptosporangiaceae bacterium]|nr:mannan endo,4-beta-mannosidase [Cryptosporangiaceae bacterium]